ncbi:MAG TPA: methylenetetrahydrofolate reductase [Myxococcota bacterium]|nr:methylenetetrahydrofolate reductase [Myxococcota bacterium]
MKVTELWKSKDKPSISFELFPARDEKAAGKLPGIIGKLAECNPDFVSVTFGAGGSTREGSFQLAKMLMQEHDLTTVAYFTCYGLGPKQIISVLDDYRDLGVETVLAARGDPPQDLEGFEAHPESLEHASDLLAFIKPRYDFCLAAAGYPEGHIEAESLEEDIGYVKLKADSGADFIISNYCYDNSFFFDFRKRLNDMGVDTPILPGVMPIYSEKMMYSLAELCGATITNEIKQGLAGLPEGDKDALFEFAVEFAVRQCSELIRSGVPGIHIYSMDRAKAPLEIVKRLRSTGLV